MGEKRDLLKDRLGSNYDAFCEALMEAHEGLTFEQCLRMDARLILILASQIGDPETLSQALAAARSNAK